MAFTGSDPARELITERDVSPGIVTFADGGLERMDLDLESTSNPANDADPSNKTGGGGKEGRILVIKATGAWFYDDGADLYLIGGAHRGSNSNGEWVRYPTGIEEFWQESVDIGSYSNSNKLTGSWTAPIDYLDDHPTKCNAQFVNTSGGTFDQYCTGLKASPGSDGVIVLEAYSEAGNWSDGDYVRVDLHFIGRWK